MAKTANEIKPNLPRLVDSNSKSNLTITEDLNKKIKFLCSKIPNLEWSGILIYKREGDIDNIESLSFTAVDLYLMDKGTSAATNYEFGTEVLSLYDEHPEYMDGYSIGHVH